MANRIVLGTQTGYTVGGQFEQGLFISRPGQDVTAAANRRNLLFRSITNASRVVVNSVEVIISSGSNSVNVTWTQRLPFTPFVDFAEATVIPGSLSSLRRIQAKSTTFELINQVDANNYEVLSGQNIIVDRISGAGCRVRLSGDRNATQDVYIRILCYNFPTETVRSEFPSTTYIQGPIHGTSSFITTATQRADFSTLQYGAMLDDGTKSVMTGARWSGSTYSTSGPINTINYSTLHLRTDLSARMPVVTLFDVGILGFTYAAGWLTGTRRLYFYQQSGETAAGNGLLLNVNNVYFNTMSSQAWGTSLSYSTVPHNSTQSILSRTAIYNTSVTKANQWQQVSLRISDPTGSRGPPDSWYNKNFVLEMRQTFTRRIGFIYSVNYRAYINISFSRE